MHSVRIDAPIYSFLLRILPCFEFVIYQVLNPALKPSIVTPIDDEF